MKQNLVIEQGATFLKVLRWESTNLMFVPVASITQAAPPTVVTTIPHGLPDGWRVAFVSCIGMEQINAHSPVRDSDYQTVHVVSSDTIILPDLDTADFDQYAGGGYLRFYTPTSLAGCDGRMSIKDRIQGTELLALNVSNGRVLFDDVLKTITLTIAASDTAAIQWLQGVYDFEAVSGAIVTRLLQGSVRVSQEVTT